MGGVYLAYSAYFLSIDFSVVYTVMNIIMCLLFLGLGSTFWISAKTNIKKIDNNLQFMRDNDENIMRESLQIKRSMLSGIMFGTGFFCLIKALNYGVTNNLGNEFLSVKFNCFG